MEKETTNRPSVQAIVGLHPGEVLIPVGGYCYCIRVDEIYPVGKRRWNDPPFATQRVVCTRYDLSDDRTPVYEHPHPLHCRDLYAVTQDIFRECPDKQQRIWPHRPEYFRKWKPKTGQLCLF